MYGPDPFTTMAYARMLRAQADERERARRRRPQRPRHDDATEPIAAPYRAMATAVLVGVRALFFHSLATLRGFVRPREAT